MPSTIEHPQLRRVPKDTSPDEIISIVQADGGVIIQNFLSQDQLKRFNTEIDPTMKNLNVGSTHTDSFISTFHSNKTKRLTNSVTRSRTFREELLDHDSPTLGWVLGPNLGPKLGVGLY